MLDGAGSSDDGLPATIIHTGKTALKLEFWVNQWMNKWKILRQSKSDSNLAD